MRPPEREEGNADFLVQPFVAIPVDLIRHCGDLGIDPEEFVVLAQVIASLQTGDGDFLAPQELAKRSGLSVRDAGDAVGRLVAKGLLSVGERLENDGTRSNYYDLKPLWQRLRGRESGQSAAREWRRDPFSLFEEEFGRPLSGLECEQIRQWLEEDGHPEWLVIEALREAVLANKYSFKYIDRVLYEWQRNRVRTRQELEAYRQSYRERQQAREQTAATKVRSTTGRRRDAKSDNHARDERYTAFYQLFPDA
jgi:DNA replication protein